jgi:hypothetical protein
VPVLTAHVYRQANLTNASKYVLLPGEATMYNGSDFVGRMNLPLVAVGEQFTAGFGSDPQLQVQRQMMDKSRAMQGGNQVLKFEYRILLSSYKPERVKVQVWDRLPAAVNETMGVSLVKAAPELCKDPVYGRARTGRTTCCAGTWSWGRRGTARRPRRSSTSSSWSWTARWPSAPSRARASSAPSPLSVTSRW